MAKIDYDKLLDEWHEKVLTKAREAEKKASEFELGSNQFRSYKCYSDGLMMALAMLSTEERKYRRRNEQDRKQKLEDQIS